MNCKCGDVMNMISVFDSPNDGYAYNLYQCDACGMICKDDVWKSAGFTWINSDGIVLKEIK